MVCPGRAGKHSACWLACPCVASREPNEEEAPSELRGFSLHMLTVACMQLVRSCAF